MITVKVFDEKVVQAVVSHMGDDHAADNLLIAKANGYPEATKSDFIDLDETGGVWRVTEGDKTVDLRVDWPNAPISERAEIRREVVLVYRAACEKLGIDPNSHEEAQKPFSVLLREGSWSDHDDSEGADFMASIMRGQASLEDYVQLVAQHYFMYEALESEVAKYIADPLFAEFHVTELDRMEALRLDLEKLIGANWRDEIRAYPATEEYAARIHEVGDSGWLAGLVAHHYTRYLGDLSGGQMIARRVAKQHGFDDGRGVEFYNFETLGGIDEFKGRYRAALDRLGLSLDDTEKKRMLEEVREAYRFNTAVFGDMKRLRPQAA